MNYLFGSFNINMDVKFDSPVCYPGGEISGKVMVTVAKDVTIRALILKYQIVEQHEHITSIRFNSVTAGNYARSKAEEKLPVLHEKEVTLFGDTKVGGAVLVKPGSYEYEFRIPVPPTAPPTMNEPFLIGVRDTCCISAFDMPNWNSQMCGLQAAQALTIQHRVSAEVVVPRSTNKVSSVLDVPRVLAAYHPRMFPPSLSVRQSEKSYRFDRCRGCFCHSMETEEQAEFTMNAPRPYVLLSRGSKGCLDVFVGGHINCPFDIMLVRFAREINDRVAQSEKIYQDRKRGMDDRRLCNFIRPSCLGVQKSFRETSHVIASIHSPDQLHDQSPTGKRFALEYDHAMFSDMCTYIGRRVTIVYALVIRMEYDGVCCGGVDVVKESRLPITVVHECGFVPDNDYRFLPQDPPNCVPWMSACQRPPSSLDAAGGGMGMMGYQPPVIGGQHQQQQQQAPHPQFAAPPQSHIPDSSFIVPQPHHHDPQHQLQPQQQQQQLQSQPEPPLPSLQHETASPLDPNGHDVQPTPVPEVNPDVGTFPSPPSQTHTPPHSAAPNHSQLETEHMSEMDTILHMQSQPPSTSTPLPPPSSESHPSQWE